MAKKGSAISNEVYPGRLRREGIVRDQKGVVNRRYNQNSN